MSEVAGFADVNCARLYYEMKGDGHPLVLIHGGFMDTRMWDDQLPVFSSRYTVVRYDVRGHGKSDRPNEPYSNVEDLSGLLQYLGIPQAYLLGQSMGGVIAIDFALVHPEEVDALIPVASGLSGFAFSDDANQEIDKVVSAAREEGASQAVAVWLTNPMMLPAQDNVDLERRIREILNDHSFIPFVNPVPVRKLEPPARQRLVDIRVPTLVVVGDRDVPDVRTVADLLAASIVGARQVVIHGAGHMVNMERPFEFNQLVFDFLANR